MGCSENSALKKIYINAYITKKESSKNNTLWHYFTYVEKQQRKPKVSHNKGNHKYNNRNQ